MHADDTLTLLPNGGWDERVLVCACGSLVQLFVIVGEHTVALVDTGGTPTAAAGLLDLARPYLQDRRLVVINTHADWDHAWGNQVFAGPQALHTAPIIASRRCAERLRSSEEHASLEAMRREQVGRFDAVQLTPPDIAFEGELLLDCGGLRLRLFPTPGHTPDHLAILIPEASLILAGDAAESPFPYVNEPADLPLLRASIRQLADLRPRDLLCCHAPLGSGPALLDANLAYFDRLERSCREALAAQGSGTLAELDAPVADVAFSFDEAASGRTFVDGQEVAFYQVAHSRAIKAMLTWLTMSA